MVDVVERTSTLTTLVRRITLSTRAGRLSPRGLFVDPSHEIERAAAVFGTARSGTTKLAELLSTSPGVRLIMEPLHPFRSPVVPPDFAWGQYVGPGAPNRAVRDVLDDCLRGRLRDFSWLDRFNRARLARRRVVKLIAGTNLSAWFVATFPRVPAVYLVRHPFAVAASVANSYESDRAASRSSGWRQQVFTVVDELVERSGLLEGPLASRARDVRAVWRVADHPFDRTVLRWCLENYVTLTSPPPELKIVHFEHVFTDPLAHLPAIADHLGFDLPEEVYRRLDTPSRTDFRRTPELATANERIADWTWQVAPERLAAGLALLEIFELDRFYAADAEPVHSN